MDAPAAYWEHLRQRQGTLRGCLQAQRAQGWRAWNRSVPQLLVLVGLEGAGHHALQPLLRHAARNHPNTTVVDRVQEYVSEDAARLVSPSRLWRDLCTTHRLGCDTPRRGTRVFNVGGSHPFHQPRRATRFVDPIAVEALDRTLHRVDARFLFLVRNPLDLVVADAVHRNFASAEVQSRILELTMLYVQHVWDALPCDKTLLMPYEFLTAHPTHAGTMIGHLLAADAPLQARLRRAAAVAIRPRHGGSEKSAAAQLPRAVVQFWQDRVAWRWAPIPLGAR